MTSSGETISPFTVKKSIRALGQMDPVCYQIFIHIRRKVAVQLANRFE